MRQLSVLYFLKKLNRAKKRKKKQNRILFVFFRSPILNVWIPSEKESIRFLGTQISENHKNPIGQDLILEAATLETVPKELAVM